MRYDHKAVEKKWQNYWDEHKIFAASELSDSPRQYVLDMFPYPSAEGLHVGHPEGYTATDIYSRYLKMKGANVLHPMGWDAFGLPTENYAIKVKRNPKEVATENINNFRRQIKSLGFSYDWNREINTSDPAYYKWTQWLFLKLFEKGLAYRKEAPVNWCPSCQTVLANEQVVNGACERCHTAVEQKQMAQWFFKITDYAERLLSDLEGLDWPSPIIEMQKNWIGKSEGAIVEFAIRNSPPQADHPWAGQSVIPIYTTRLDTIFGATYVVLAPEHETVRCLKDKIANWPEVENYIDEARRKTELERKVEEKEKTGVRLDGIEAINPANNERIPVFIADYVLVGYGTGAIMAVPAHDERDFAFAKKYHLPVIKVIEAPPVMNIYQNADSLASGARKTIRSESECWIGDGTLINSKGFDGLDTVKAREAIREKLGGMEKIQYKLRDWLISRQRYWGVPIPIIYCESCGIVTVPEKDLPVLLPDDVDFRPTGESPLARSKSFHSVNCPQCGKSAKRESDTMDTFVDSSWYFLRFADPHNDKEPFDNEKIKHWLPVNLYVGGAEHAVMHLLYARFFTKVLADLSYVHFQEPFLKLRNQGLVLGEDGQKMSKSRGNVVNPDEVVAVYGADTLRLYEMFVGPFEDAKPWNTQSIAGMRRFLERAWHIVLDPISQSGAIKATAEQEQDLRRWSAKTIKKVTIDIESFRFNTAISALIEFVNFLYGIKDVTVPLKDEARQTLLLLLHPFAPHITSELWQAAFPEAGYVWEEPWLKYDPEALQTDTITVVVQVNGKLRGNIVCQTGASDEEIERLARQEPNVAKMLMGKKISKIIVKSGRLVNFVTE